LVEEENSEECCKCRLCMMDVSPTFSLCVLEKYTVQYYVCPSCGLMQTEYPYWLGEAYGEAISSVDTGILARNLYFMKISAVFLKMMEEKNKSYLDYGGGHGVFTRLMRDHGFDFYWCDAYAKNFFARGFSYKEGNSVEGVTAFEVLEHLDDPKQFFHDILGGVEPKYFIASTELFSGDENPEWKYLFPMTGQHIVFYQEKTLKMVASEYGYYYSHYRGMHFFSKSKISNFRIKLIVRGSRFLYPLLKFPSLLMDDHELLVKRIKSGKYE